MRPQLLFFASGALGLVYEVLWVRQLGLVFGSTALATTATLSGFFLGLALGSAAFGERARRYARPLRAFGLLELGVGLGALLLPLWLALYRQAYPALYAALAPWPLAFAGVKLALAMLAVGLPAFCMGGTLPVLAELVAPSGRELGRPVGGLYAWNVLGATLGALAVPFVMLPRLGADAAYLCAVGGSATVGLLAWVFGAQATRGSSTTSGVDAGHAGWPSLRLLLLSALSGAGTLALQVLFTRALSLVHENSIYSFAVVVAVFLVGLAGGAALARLALRGRRAPERLLGWSWCAAALLVAVSPRLFAALTGGLTYLAAGEWSSVLLHLLGLAGLTMLPATLALGLALPLLMELLGRSGQGTLGRLLAANTMGAILGPLLATFVVAPLLGLWWSFVACAAVLALAGLLQLGRAQRVPVTALLLAAFLLSLPTGLPPVRVGPGERLVSVREGSYGTTAVLADEHERWISVNNAYVLGGTAAAAEERFQAHLALLLHPRPSRVAFLGLGTGISAGAALLHPVESVLALELVPEVAQAARADFADVNAGVLQDPRVALVADDGRNYLAAEPAAFDVIVGDLLVPWRPAEAPLYTQEHFELVRRALRDDGLFCQWLPLYQLSAEQLAILARTFVEVFPGATLWRGNFVPQAPTLALIGRKDGRPIDAAAVDGRVRALRVVPELDVPFLAHPAGLWLSALGPLDPRAAWLRDAPTNRDARPWVELLSPRTQGGARRGDPSELLAEAEAAPLVGLDDQQRAWRARGSALARASARGQPSDVLELLRDLPPELRAALGVEG